EAPQHRFRERVLDRFALERVSAARSERLVALNQQHARADAVERNDPRAAAGAAIEADVVRPETCRQTRREEELDVEARDLEKHRARTLVPVEREVAIQFLHAAGARIDPRHRAAGGLLRAAASALA